MDTSQLDQLSHILQALISTGLGMRCVYLFIKLMHEDEEAARYRKRLKNTVIFAVIAQLPFVIESLIIGYLT